MAEADVPRHFASYHAARAQAEPLGPLARAWVARSSPGAADLAWLESFARDARTRWDAAAHEAELVANHPRLQGNDVVLCEATRRTLKAVHGGGLWRPGLDDRLRYAAVLALNQNGEGGVACSVACTDGLIRVLCRHPAGHEAALARLRAMGPQSWLHGAQFVTEIQGGSDVAANTLEARPAQDGAFALHGQKWFCSNLSADLWLVTARATGAPDGAKGLSLFLVERSGGGYTLERLKDKVGTRALPTAEILFHGALGRPVGPLGEGLRIVVAEVLVPSRIHNILACAGFLRRAQQEATAYAATRTAFGKGLRDLPLVADTLDRLAAAADLAEAGACATADAWLRGMAEGARDEDAHLARVLVSLHKAVATRRAQALVQEALSVLGGNGIEERFSCLPRLWRDSVILETWEGPYTLLLGQALADLRHGGGARHAADFLRLWLGRDPEPTLRAAFEACLAAPANDVAAATTWRELAHHLVTAWEARALAELRPQRAPG